MVDLTDQERAAISAAVKPLAGAMGEIGWGTRFQDLTEPQVLGLIEAAVGAFQRAMQVIARDGARQEGPV